MEHLNRGSEMPQTYKPAYKAQQPDGNLEMPLKVCEAAQSDPIRKRQQHYTLKWSTTTMVTSLLIISPRSMLNLVNRPEQKEKIA